MDRRKFLGTGSSALLLASCATSNVTSEAVSDIEQGESAFIPEPTLNAAIPEKSLSSIARSKGVNFGTAIGTVALNDAEYLKIIEAECDVLVAENEHKLYSLQKQPGPYKFNRGDALVNWGKTKGLDFRGHVLLWNRMEFTPDWVAQKDFGGREGTEKFMADHIKTLTEHYGKDIHSWDVVNETINPKTGKMRDTVFVKNAGEQIVDFAFHKAKEYAPHAELVYNDYMIWEEGHEKHRYGVLKLLEGFRKRGTPIDTFGVQGHLGGLVRKARYPEPQSKAWRQFIDEIVGMDYKLIISEFDVNDRGLPAGITKRDQEIAAYGKAFLDMMLSYTELKSVLAWGLCDRHSWLQTWWPRKDGVIKRPTLYDINYQPKPLREAVARAFENAPPRSA